MLEIMLSRFAEFATTVGGREVIFPGQPEPEWLRRNAQHARELPLLRAEQRSAAAELRRAGERAGLLARLRLVLSRG